MGVTARYAKYIKWTQERFHLDFSDTVTLGRLFFYYGDKDVFLDDMKKYFDLKLILQEDGYSENFFRSLSSGGGIVNSIDHSDYEGASILMNLNKKIPKEYEDRFTAVVDGGLLEQVFDFPRAIKNCMDMCSTGGVLYIATPCNNHCGHGFYQFSPELFFSLLSKKNGFEILDMSYVEVNGENGKLKRIRHLQDNTITKQRVEINTRWQAEIFLVARKIGAIPKSLDIQQSDYLAAWEGKTASTNFSLSNRLKEKILKVNWVYKINKLRHVLQNNIQKLEGEYSLDEELNRK